MSPVCKQAIVLTIETTKTQQHENDNEGNHTSVQKSPKYYAER